MGIPDIKFGYGAFQLDSLFFDVGSGEGMVRVCCYTGHRCHHKRQDK
jgi:hypothetical protein